MEQKLRLWSISLRRCDPWPTSLPRASRWSEYAAGAAAVPVSVYTLPDLDALDRIMNARGAGLHLRPRRPPQRPAPGRPPGRAGGGRVGPGHAAPAWRPSAPSCSPRCSRAAASSPATASTAAPRSCSTQELARFGVETTFVDTNDLDEVGTRPGRRRRGCCSSRRCPTRCCASPTCRRLAELAHEHDCLLVVDNTFATPVLTRPLELGADLVMESLTKMIGGHSDVTLGLRRAASGDDVLPEMTPGGQHLGPGVQPVRLLAGRARPGDAALCACARASHNAAALADWLADQPGVARVVYPGRPDHPDHALAPAAARRAASATCSASSWPAAARRSTASCGRRRASRSARRWAHDDDLQPPRHHVAPLRQPGREAAAGDHRRADPAVGGGRGAGGDPAGAGPGAGVELFSREPWRARRRARRLAAKRGVN